MNVTQRKELKAKAHSLKPTVTIGNAGLTEAVLTEIELALNTHELIKIKVRAEREDRKRINDNICLSTKADFIQAIGQILIIYRSNPGK